MLPSGAGLQLCSFATSVLPCRSPHPALRPTAMAAAAEALPPPPPAAPLPPRVLCIQSHVVSGYVGNKVGGCRSAYM